MAIQDWTMVGAILFCLLLAFLTRTRLTPSVKFSLPPYQPLRYSQERKIRKVYRELVTARRYVNNRRGLIEHLAKIYGVRPSEMRRIVGH
jgi:hypothetical protein